MFLILRPKIHHVNDYVFEFVLDNLRQYSYRPTKPRNIWLSPVMIYVFCRSILSKNPEMGMVRSMLIILHLPTLMWQEMSLSAWGIKQYGFMSQSRRKTYVAASICRYYIYNLKSNPCNLYLGDANMAINTWLRHQMRHFPRYWPFVRGIHRSPLKSQWHGALMFSLIYAWMNVWVNNGGLGDLRHRRTHYGVTVMMDWILPRYSTSKPMPILLTWMNLNSRMDKYSYAQ